MYFNHGFYLQGLLGSMLDIRWHFIGCLQKKNTKKLVGKSRHSFICSCVTAFLGKCDGGIHDNE